MASMTDVIFLLLIFFMITSTAVSYTHLDVYKRQILECMMSKVNSSEFSVVDVRVTAIVVITVPSPVAVTALSLSLIHI